MLNQVEKSKRLSVIFFFQSLIYVSLTDRKFNQTISSLFEVNEIQSNGTLSYAK